MEKILSIIIPSYKEIEKEIFPLLSSIANQVGLNKESLEIIIVRDGTEPLNLEIFDILELDIQQTILEQNGGPGVARQAGIERSTGKYLMFCDADDVIQNVGIIKAMIEDMETKDWDILKTNWLEEVYNATTQQYIYVNHELENTWMHGKMFKRSFIINNNISFHPKLRVHEDSYFLSIAAEYSTKTGYLPVASYIWKWGGHSLTRENNGNYTYNSSIVFIEACMDANKIIEIIHPLAMNYKIVQFILYHYFTLHNKGWMSAEQQEQREKTEKYFVERVKPFMKYWTNSDSAFIAKIYNEERAKHFNTDVEFETLNQWMTRIGLLN